MQKQVRLAVVGGIVVMLLLMIFSIASAKSILVDGVPLGWDEGDRVYTNPTPSAYGEVGITSIYQANDAANIYWRFDTISETDWSEAGYFALCMNTDLTITNTAAYGPCPASTDFVVMLEPNFGTAELWDALNDRLVTTATVQVAAGLTVTEMSVDRASLALDTCATICDVPTLFRMDASQVYVESAGAPGAPLDFEVSAEAPAGSWVAMPRIDNSSPTAVGLAEFNARIVNVRLLDWRIVAALGVLVAGLVAVRRIKN